MGGGCLIIAPGHFLVCRVVLGRSVWELRGVALRGMFLAVPGTLVEGGSGALY